MRAKLDSLQNLNRRVLLVAWLSLGLIVLIASQACSSIWAFGNWSPHHWDNALYVNRAWGDFWAYTNGGPTQHRAGVRGVWDSLINADPYAPPAYRMATVPFIFWGGRMLAVLRAVSLLVFWLTLYVIYRTGVLAIEGPAGRAVGIVSAMLVGMYLEVGWSIRIYGTEFTLYFSTALLLYCLVRGTRAHRWPHLTWIGLGFALGLGGLSKVSFVLIGVPPLVLAFVLTLMRRMPGLTIWKWVGSGLIALVMAWPFYSRHWADALNYAQDMTHFTRHSLHRRGWELLVAWAQLHVTEGIGYRAASILGLLLLIAMLTFGARLGFNFRARSASAQDPNPLLPGPAFSLSPVAMAVMFAASQALVLPLYQLFFSQSNNVRHITPAYLPLTVCIVLLAGWAGALLDWQGWAVLFVSGWLAFAQLYRIDFPLTTTVDDTWNWAPFYQLVESHGVRFPMIGQLGNTPQYCEPFLTEPWISRGRFANDLWLWKPEDGPFNLPAIQKKLADRNVVVTAPDLQMPPTGGMLSESFQPDNANNAQFAQAMQHDPAWSLAGKFPIGVITRAEIWVFVRR